MWWPRLDVGARCQVAGERHDVCSVERKKLRRKRNESGHFQISGFQKQLVFSVREKIIRGNDSLARKSRIPTRVAIHYNNLTDFFFLFSMSIVWMESKEQVPDPLDLDWADSFFCFLFLFRLLLEGFCFAFLWSFVFYFFLPPDSFRGG